MESKRTKASKLIALCQKNLRENEYNSRKLKGVLVSASDVGMVILYCQTILRCGTYEGELMSPHCEVKDVLEKSGLLDNQ